MSDVLNLDYTVADAAEDDLTNWSGNMTRYQSTSPFTLGMTAYTATGTSVRAVSGLTADTEYEVSVNVQGIADPAEVATFTLTVEGEHVDLTTLGTHTLTFTATGTTANLVFSVDEIDDFDPPSLYLSSLVVGDGGGPTPGVIVVTGYAPSHMRDQVDIVAATGGATLATLPAYVGYTSTGLDNSQTGRLAAIEELRAMVPTFNYDQSQHRIRWRGKLYTSDGPGLQRLQRGQDHHLSIPIKAVAG